MVDRMWLLLTFGPLVWMALIAILSGWDGEDPAWVRALILYCKALCINIAVVSIWLAWIDKASG
jgi:hypothetical protein